MHERIYVCHTFYHVYVACLKELAARPFDGRRDRAEFAPEATLMLSNMSTDFGTLTERARACGLFEEVIGFDEKRDDFFPELKPLRENTGNIVTNMMNRVRFCKRFPALEAPYVPVDFHDYKDIFVFCDSDPVGYYLNANKIYYHAMEDGLNCLKRFDAARFDNRGAFPVKAFFARMGWIFIQNGYAKYCLDMEVNDLRVVGEAEKQNGPYALQVMGRPVYKEVSRQALADALSDGDKRLLADLFVENMETLRDVLSQGEDRPRVLVLTEKILDAEARKKLFEEIVSRYQTWNGQQALVFVKPHPRDEADYAEMGPVIVLPSNFPMEVLNLMEELQFDAVVSVFTQTDAVKFAKERISLAEEFAYAAPELQQAGVVPGQGTEM